MPRRHEDRQDHDAIAAEKIASLLGTLCVLAGMAMRLSRPERPADPTGLGAYFAFRADVGLIVGSVALLAWLSDVNRAWLGYLLLGVAWLLIGAFSYWL